MHLVHKRSPGIGITAEVVPSRAVEHSQTGHQPDFVTFELLSDAHGMVGNDMAAMHAHHAMREPSEWNSMFCAVAGDSYTAPSCM